MSAGFAPEYRVSISSSPSPGLGMFSSRQTPKFKFSSTYKPTLRDLVAIVEVQCVEEDNLMVDKEK
jgi:hypothetical protein